MRKPAIVGFSFCAVAMALDARPVPLTVPLTVRAETRLLVVTPHPDDEVIAAGGLIQRVHALGGAVRAVYLTDGEGYVDAIRAEEHGATPRSADYRRYGRRREREARAALERLGIDRGALTFLGFPNNGLNRLLTRYWSERRAAFHSPYTRRDRPLASEIVVPDTKYRGEDLTQELAQIIGSFQPTVIVAPRREDQHVDHCAAWYFVGDALVDVHRVQPDFHADLMGYIVHYYSWPFETDSRRLPPPELPAPGGWLTLSLTADEARAKREALRAYDSQMKAMGWFLMGFARTSEVFSRPASRHVTLPIARDPCGLFVDPALTAR